MTTMSADTISFDDVFVVNDTWDVIKTIPNYEEIAGELLFRK